MGLFDHLIPKPEPQSGLRRVADLPLELASGVARGVKFTADAFGADNAVSRGAGAVDDYARSLLSAQAQADDQRISQIMAEAQDAGVWEQVKAAAQAFAVSPVRTTVNALGTSVPTIAATMIPGVGQAGAAARIGMLGAMGAAQGAGVVKGSIYEAVKAEQMQQPGVTEEEAIIAATRAQEYAGPNAGNIAGGAALWGAASATGVQPILAKMIQPRGLLAQEAADKTQGLLAAAGLKLSDKPPGPFAAAGLGVLKEAPLEALQGGQEQYASNVALQREGFDVPTFRGVAGSAALEGLASAPGGAVFGALDRPRGMLGTVVPEQKPKASIGDVLSAEGIDEAAKAAFEAAGLGKELSLVPEGALPDGLDFEADPEVNRGRIVRSGEQGRPIEVFATKQAADIAIGSRGLLGQVDAVQVGPNAWTIGEQARTDGIELPDIPDAREMSDAERVAYLNSGRFSFDRQRGRAPLPEATEVIPTPDATEVEPIPVADAFEEIPTGDAAEVLPIGETSELIPTGDAQEMQRTPIATGRATELEVETIQADDLLTGDGMPYGSKVAANVRAKREGLTSANVVEIPGAGWVVRPQPTTLGTAIEAAPNNTRSTNAADALRSLRDQRNMAAAPAQPAGARDGRGDNSGGSGVAVGSVPSAPGRVVQPAAGVGAGDRANQPVADGGRADAALTPEAIVGRTFDMDGKRWTVAAAGKRYITIADDTGKERVISDSSVKWPAVRKALAPIDTSAGPVEAAGGSGQVAPQKQRESAALAVYQATESPGYEGLEALDLDDADFEIEALQAQQERGRLRVESLAQTEFGKRLDAGAIMALNEAMRADPAGTLQAIRSLIAGKKRPTPIAKAPAPQPEVDAAPAAEPVAEAPEVAAAPAPQAPPEGRAPEAAAPAKPATLPDTAAPTNPPAPAAQTRPQELIELRKRAAVLKQLLRCLL